ncbi:TPA: hypothetical protein OUC91_003401, partial [Enterobacter hormaechei]|nr:hypothetical protein [Enterobacter hormaechei]
FYIVSAAVILLFNVLKDNFVISRYLGSLSVSLLFVAFLSFIYLRDFDISISQLKAAIKIRQKKNKEKEAMLKLLNTEEDFSPHEKDYFKRYRGDE